MRFLIVALAVAALPRPAAASVFQCPDGTPPPCAAARAPARQVAVAAPDPATRIVVLPFRVTTTDTLLGEGLAELIAGAFTGEGGPRAVPMGNVIRGWRDAGGAPRVPLPTGVAERVTRQLGAGLYVDGSIVGLGQRLTLSASVQDLSNGSVRRTTPVSGTMDSLPALLERLTAGLLQAAGIQRAPQAARMSDSPDAVRAYIEGLAAFRRFRFVDAAAGFERAFALDPQFGRAAFMRWMTAGWGPGFGTPVQTLWRERTRQLRDRVSAQDQLVLDAALGNQALRERTVAANPDLPEVWYYIGDSYYHNARAQGWDNLSRARAAFERSVALDSQPTSLHHLVEIGLWTSDTALLRTAWTAFDRLAPGNHGLGMAVAHKLGDARMLEAMRRRPPRGVRDTFDVAEAMYWGPAIGMPAALVDEAFQRTIASPPPNLMASGRPEYFLTAMNAGRPAAAARAMDGRVLRDSVALRGFNSDVAQMMTSLLNDGDPSLGRAAERRVRAARYADSSDLAVARCGLRLWDALRGDSIVLDDELLRAQRQGSCAVTLHALAAQRAGTLDSAAMARFDSMAVAAPGTFLWPYAGVGSLILGRLWESAGARSQALRRVRAASLGLPDLMMGARRITEARYATALGDTAAAIRVYREYLELRRYAEPVLVPQRDSAQAELDRLLGRGRPIP